MEIIEKLYIITYKMMEDRRRITCNILIKLIYWILSSVELILATFQILFPKKQVWSCIICVEIRGVQQLYFDQIIIPIVPWLIFFI